MVWGRVAVTAHGRLGLVVAAGGQGRRFGAGRPKQHVLLACRMLLECTVEALEACPEVETIVVCVEGEGLERWRRLLLVPSHPKVRDVVSGGGTRALSVRNGLHRLVELEQVDWIGVHDGARPLVGCGLVRALMERLAESPHLDGVLPSLPPNDSIKEIDGRGMIIQNLDRSRLVAVQTPQVFRAEVLLRAYAQPDSVLAAATDDASLVEKVGGRVGAVPGELRNLKVTNPLDLAVAEMLLSEDGCGGC